MIKCSPAAQICYEAIMRLCKSAFICTTISCTLSVNRNKGIFFKGFNINIHCKDIILPNAFLSLIAVVTFSFFLRVVSQTLLLFESAASVACEKWSRGKSRRSGSPQPSVTAESLPESSRICQNWRLLGPVILSGETLVTIHYLNGLPSFQSKPHGF